MKNKDNYVLDVQQNKVSIPKSNIGFSISLRYLRYLMVVKCLIIGCVFNEYSLNILLEF